MARLFEMLSSELHHIAAAFLRNERCDHTLQPTALVHEAFLRMIDQTVIAKSDQQRFVGFAARAMRRVLVDHARRRNAQRRGGGDWKRVTLAASLAETDGPTTVDLVELNGLLERFEQVDPRACRVVELKFFADLSFDEIAATLGVNERTAYRDWSVARVWLARALSDARDA